MRDARTLRELARWGMTSAERLVDDLRAIVYVARLIRAHADHIGFVGGCAFCDARKGVCR